MQYPKVKEGEVEEYMLLAEGEGTFQVNVAEESTSKAGNEMIKLTLQAWDKDGQSATIFDYLVSMESMKWKIKHFFESIGMGNKYGEVDLTTEMCELKHGKCILKTQKDKEGKYKDKTVIKEYLPADNNGEIDDDIPF